MSLRHIVYLWSVLLYNIFPNYLTKEMILKKRGIETKICVLSFSKISARKFPHSKDTRGNCDRKKSIGRRVQYPSFLFDFNET